MGKKENRAIELCSFIKGGGSWGVGMGWDWRFERAERRQVKTCGKEAKSLQP